MIGLFVVGYKNKRLVEAEFLYYRAADVRWCRTPPITLDKTRMLRLSWTAWVRCKVERGECKATALRWVLPDFCVTIKSLKR